jgi:dTDP-glucose 4,6-dehydratase
MRILLTGASGFVGEWIAERLLQEGCQVVAIGRRSPKLCSASLEFLHADLSKPGVFTVLRSFSGFDAVVHSAAMLSTSMLDADVTLVNTYGTHQLVQAAVKYGIPRFVYLSGTSVVGTPGKSPLTESTPANPCSAYLASKAYGEFLVERCYGPHGVFTTLRVTAPIGKGIPEGRFLSVLIKNAKAGLPLEIYGRGTRRQNYVDVRDVAQAAWLGLRSAQSGVFNIGGTCSVSNVDLAKLCIATLQSNSQIMYSGKDDPEESHHWDVCIDAARQKIGYAPQYDLNASILHIAEDSVSPAVRRVSGR